MSAEGRAGDARFGPLDDALRRAAARDAEAVVARARSVAERRLAEARAEADELERRARLEGEAAAEDLIAYDRTATRRDAAELVLRAREAVYDELRARIHTALRELRDAPEYAEVVEGLAARARRQLGADARVVDDPGGLGGVVAERGGRRVDDTLPALADRAFADVMYRVEEIWQ